MMEAKRPISCLSFTQVYSLMSYPRHLDGLCDRRQCVLLAINPFTSRQSSAQGFHGSRWTTPEPSARPSADVDHLCFALCAGASFPSQPDVCVLSRPVDWRLTILGNCLSQWGLYRHGPQAILSVLDRSGRTPVRLDGGAAGRNTARTARMAI